MILDIPKPLFQNLYDIAKGQNISVATLIRKVLKAHCLDHQLSEKINNEQEPETN